PQPAAPAGEGDHISHSPEASAPILYNVLMNQGLAGLRAGPGRLEDRQARRERPGTKERGRCVRKPSRGEVESFIGTSFRSVWAFELLCLLKRNSGKSLS